MFGIKIGTLQNRTTSSRASSGKRLKNRKIGVKFETVLNQ